MVWLPLSEFIRAAPTGSTTGDPSRWLDACLANDADCVVLLEHQMPIQVLTLRHLMQLVRTPATAAPRHHFGGHSHPTCPLPGTGDTPSPPLRMMPLTVSAAAAAQQVAADLDCCWLVIDEQQHYQGVLDTARLLATAVTILTSQEVSAAQQETVAETQTSKSNTALLTYLGHELKTPLTSLLGLSSLLKIGRLGDLTPRQERYIGLIQQHCRRLAAWVNTLIDLGRIDSGTLNLIPQMVNVGDLWSEAYHQAMLRVGHEPTAAYPRPAILDDEAHPITLVADQTRLQQMLSCLIQTALAAQGAGGADPRSPLGITLWDDWVAFTVERLDETLPLEQLAQTVLTFPFPESSVPSTPISAEMGHWLEWLLVRKLAQQHQGELVLMVRAARQICPTLLMPVTPASAARGSRRFLLVVAPLDHHSLPTLWQQANQLSYHLLITANLKDAVEVATHLPLQAVLVLMQSPSQLAELPPWQLALANTDSLTIALVPPQLSALLGELPLDRELLWPTERLGSVLLQPPASLPAPNRLTILYLRSPEPSSTHDSKFPHIFHDFGCRVLEVDDVEQASLLNRVWQPDVAVLDPAIASPTAYLQNLSRFPQLTSLPLITLTMTATQAAHAIAALSVFPCLVEESAWNMPDTNDRLTTWLIQVLQVAATSSSQTQD
ncbi:MAG: histidine kinase dimerization/phospho-acceptor domain-containing protein [Leptolyngbyaceae cyanobacterium]